MAEATSQPLLLSIAKSLEQTSIALLVRESLWGFQITVALHILGMILSVGTVVWMDSGCSVSACAGCRCRSRTDS